MNAKISKQWLAHFICAAIGIAVIATAWDIWWHMIRIRDRFLEPPHILLYSAVGLAILGAAYGGWRFRDKTWLRLAIVFSLIPIAAPFDNWWHEKFGKEALASPLVIWSPPHMMLVVSLAVGLLLLVRIIKRDKDIVLHEFFGSMAYASFIGAIFFATAPFHPLENQHLIGFWGAGFIAFPLVLGTLLAQREFPSPLTATYVMMFFTLYRMANFHESVSSRAVIQAHPHPPAWIFIFAYIFPAIVIDLWRASHPILRGIIFGVLYGLLFYAVADYFIDPGFQYTAIEIGQAIISSIIGGFVGALIARK